MDKSTFEVKYNDSSTGLFKTNTSKDIGSDDARELVTDVKENIPFTDDDSYIWPFPGITTTTSTTAFVGTLSPAITGYSNRMKVQIKMHATSTGAATLNLNTVGAKKIYLSPTVQAGAGDLIIDQTYIMIYDSALDSASGGFIIIGASGMTNPMTTGGDIIYGGASGVPTRLANGSSGQVLTSSGGTSAPTWGALAGSTYTPTISNVTNTSALTAYSHNYMRIGSFVHVSGVCDFTVTAAVSTDVSLTLPVASNFANHYDAHGTGFSDGKDQGCILYADATSNLVFIHFVAKGTGAHTFRYEFTYRII